MSELDKLAPYLRYKGSLRLLVMPAIAGCNYKEGPTV